ncbi:MAG: ketoacid-CoA transferase [Deltaproteobacteria bacterium]|nr:ketoacid-CoA transferase [Deltaproteobacteria bacterium]
MENYTASEMMALSAGRLVKNGDILFAGTGLSMLATTVAKRIHAPGAVVFFETGGIDPSLTELPLAVADLRVMVGTSVNSSLVDALSLLSHPKFNTIAFLGAAQIDRYGNLNSTHLGTYKNPIQRFPGSGGACDASSMASGTVIFMQHERRRFVEKLDYFTSPGWLTGGDSRSKAGFSRGGPKAVVTNLGILRFDEETKAMYLSEYYPHTEPEKIAQSTGFDLDISRATQAMPPTDIELATLREEVDPQRLILGPQPAQKQTGKGAGK